MIGFVLAALLQSASAVPAWNQLQGVGAIAFACADSANPSSGKNLNKDTLVIASPDGFPQNGKIRLLVHDPHSLLGPKGVSTFWWSDDKDRLPTISFFSEADTAGAQTILLLKRDAERQFFFKGISGPVSGKPLHYYACVYMQGAGATDLIAKVAKGERG